MNVYVNFIPFPWIIDQFNIYLLAIYLLYLWMYLTYIYYLSVRKCSM